MRSAQRYIVLQAPNNDFIHKNMAILLDQKESAQGGERVRVKDKVDETIVAVCNRIQEKIKEDSFDEDKNISHMVEALAKLISARAGLEVN